MPISEIHYLSEAKALAYKPSVGTAIISITERGREADIDLTKFVKVLRVQFADAEYDDAMLKRLSLRGIAFNAHSKGFPTRQSVEPIIHFISECANNSALECLIIHCHAGKRRSAAVAKYACERLQVQFNDVSGDINKTVYILLNNPYAFEQNTMSETRKWWQLW